MEAKFDFYEIARICSPNRLKKFDGLECIIIGRACDEETGAWAYAINVYQKGPSCAFEHELKKTGRFADPDDYKTVGSVHVRVLSDGSGVLAEDAEVHYPSTSAIKSSDIKKNFKTRVANYSKLQFGKELRRRVLKKETIDEIALWAYSVYLEGRQEDQEFRKLLSILASMDQGPSFIVSHKKLGEIAINLCRGEEINFDGLL